MKLKLGPELKLELKVDDRDNDYPGRNPAINA